MRCTRTSTYRAAVHASGTTLLPLLAAADVGVYGDPAAPVLDEFMAELAVAYSFGPPWGERFVNWLDAGAWFWTFAGTRAVAWRSCASLVI